MASQESLPWEVDVRTVREMLDRGDKFLFVDCREPDEYAVAKIAGAQLIPMGEIPGRVAEFAALGDETIVVHCHHGGRSMRVARFLRGQGVPNVQSMAGGIDAWAQEIDSAVPRY